MLIKNIKLNNSNLLNLRCFHSSSVIFANTNVPLNNTDNLNTENLNVPQVNPEETNTHTQEILTILENLKVPLVNPGETNTDKNNPVKVNTDNDTPDDFIPTSSLLESFP
jgi:hypothetical protein